MAVRVRAATMGFIVLSSAMQTSALSFHVLSNSSFNNSGLVQTALHCSRAVNVTFLSSDRQLAPQVYMCEKDHTGACRYRRGVWLTPEIRSCCDMPHYDRPKECLSAGADDDPMSVFHCAQLSTTQNQDEGTVTATLSLFTPSWVWQNNGPENDIEICLVAYFRDMASDPYCILFAVQLCSTCVQTGDTLSLLARSASTSLIRRNFMTQSYALYSVHGTHWTQLFSANPDLALNPDALHEGQLMAFISQPLKDLSNEYPLGMGGAVADPLVESRTSPSYDNINYGPGGGYYT
eukprot:764147-Hanusia_phi.AAC.5